MATQTPEAKAAVRAFWEDKPCGSAHAEAPEGTRAYFDQVERRRYEAEPFIPDHARFEQAAGKDVLEIGVGLGTDFVRFARAGARLTGVDLTERSVTLVRRRLELERLDADLRVADAEQLPFPDRHFDVTYSLGGSCTTLRIPSRRCARRSGSPALAGVSASWSKRGAPGSPTGCGLATACCAAGRCATFSPTTWRARAPAGFTPAELRGVFGDVDACRIQHVGTVYDRRVAEPLVPLTGWALGWFLVISGTRAAEA
jgi:SAM-dependent methyltransferase